MAVFQSFKKKRRTGGTRVRLGPVCADQRLAMYIVISKPKRKSVKAGVVHCIIRLLKWGWHEN